MNLQINLLTSFVLSALHWTLYHKTSTNICITKQHTILLLKNLIKNIRIHYLAFI